MPHVLASIEIPGSDIDHVWAIVSDTERYPDIAAHVLQVTRRGEAETEWRLLLNGSPVGWVQHETTKLPVLLAFEQIRGDLDQLRGRWVLQPNLFGISLSLEIEFHLGVDGLAPLLDPIWKQSFQAHADALARGVADASARSNMRLT